MNSTQCEIRERGGHSMMEMVVVMSVLAGMAALSWPMLKSPLGKLRLQAAAQEVTTELSKARLKAMQSGVAQVFRFQANTGKFQVLAATDEDSTDESSSNHAEQQAVDSNQVSSAEHSPLSEESDLIADHVEFLQVKTLGPSHPDPGYARTRQFYAGVGFQPLEEITGLWPGNPCLIMIKTLPPARPGRR